MNKTKVRNSQNASITVTADELAGMLSCGEATARKIGEDAKARVVVGRRVLYSVEKVKEYVRTISD